MSDRLKLGYRAGAELPTKPNGVRLADIVVPPKRMRRLRPEVVAELANSMAAHGLINPILASTGWWQACIALKLPSGSSGRRLPPC